MGTQLLTVLLVEDNPGDARLIRESLAEAAGDHFNLETVERLADAIHRLRNGKLGAHPVGGRREHGFAIAAAQREQPREAAEAPAYFGPGRLARQRFEEFDGAVTSFDVHPGRCIGDAVLCGALGHRCQIYRAGRPHGIRRSRCAFSCRLKNVQGSGMTMWRR